MNMNMKIDIKEQYLEQFEDLLKTLPVGAVEVKKSIDEEIEKRVQEYKNGTMKTTPFVDSLNEIREKLVAKL